MFNYLIQSESMDTNTIISITNFIRTIKEKNIEKWRGMLPEIKKIYNATISEKVENTELVKISTINSLVLLLNNNDYDRELLTNTCIEIISNEDNKELQRIIDICILIQSFQQDPYISINERGQQIDAAIELIKKDQTSFISLILCRFALTVALRIYEGFPKDDEMNFLTNILNNIPEEKKELFIQYLRIL